MDVDYKKPNSSIFSDSSDHWILFRKKRFAVAGDGEYAVLRGLDLSNLNLHDFVVAWLAFADCKLDGISFRDTDFTFRAAFVGCSMKGANFTNSFGGDDLFYECDLSDAIFDTSRSWASVDLDGKKVPSYFINCRMDEGLQNFLQQDGNIVVESKENSSEIQQRLDDITKAPEVIIT